MTWDSITTIYPSAVNAQFQKCPAWTNMIVRYIGGLGLEQSLGSPQKMDLNVREMPLRNRKRKRNH